MSNKTNQFVLIDCQKDNESSDVLLVLKNKPEWMNGKLNLVGGRIEDSEPAHEAANRELMEETGYASIDRMKLMGSIIDGDTEVFCFKAIVRSRFELKPREGETQEVSWSSWDKAKSETRLIPNLKIIIPLIRSGVQGWTIRDHRSSIANGIHGIYVEVNC